MPLDLRMSPSLSLISQKRSCSSIMDEEYSSAASSSGLSPIENVEPLQNEIRCAVCNDLASGCHYLIPSCNGCKTFFRRTIVSQRKFICKNGGKCDFDKNRRCACRACRFEKCVKAGMNPQAIQYTPSANLTLSIARKRFKANSLSTSANNNLQKIHLITIQDQILQRIGYVLRIEEKHEKLRLSTFYPYDEETDIKGYLENRSAFADAEKYPTVEKWPLRPNHNTSKYDMKAIGVKFWYFVDMLLSLEYIKTFPFYHDFSWSDKLAWTRGVTIAGLVLSSAYYAYTKKSDIIIYPDGSIPFNGKPNDDLNMLEKNLRFGVVSQIADLKMDQIQYAMARAVIALSDCIPGMSEKAREILSEERSKYATGLLRYLQNKRGEDVGTRLFGETIAFINGVYRRVEYNQAYFAYRRFITRDNNKARLLLQLLLSTDP